MPAPLVYFRDGVKLKGAFKTVPELRGNTKEESSMMDLTRREFLAASIAASAAVVLPGRAAPVETGGLSTGFSGLDELKGGLQNGRLAVIAGWPGVGKTALALAMARQTAVADSKGTLFISLDRSQTELAERFLCSHARVGNPLNFFIFKKTSPPIPKDRRAKMRSVFRRAS